MRKMLTVLPILSLILFYQVPSAGAQINAPRDDLEAATEDSPAGVSRVLYDFLSLLGSEKPVASPVLLDMSGGVNPQPQPVFDSQTGVSSDTRTAVEDASVVNKGKTKSSSKDNVSLPADGSAGAGVVWGARIDRASEEVSSWLGDRNVIFTLAGIIGLFGLWVLVKVGRKLWRWMVSGEESKKTIGVS